LGQNVGNLLNNKQITWGWFQGGFRRCRETHLNKIGKAHRDYVPHHNPFQYYFSTSNSEHKPPTDIIGKTDQANHLYDIEDFWTAVANNQIPAVSFLKAPTYLGAHPTGSDVLSMQEFIINTINCLQQTPEWQDMAIIITFDDSGGWYDHVMPPIVNQSQSLVDALISPENSGVNMPMGGYQGRLGYGLRLPLLIVSPYSKENYVESKILDQTSILKFIEDNWSLGRIGDYSYDVLSGTLNSMFNFNEQKITNKLILNPETGEIISTNGGITGYCPLPINPSTYIKHNNYPSKISNSTTHLSSSKMSKESNSSNYSKHERSTRKSHSSKSSRN
jgi:phospholipase C